MTNTNTKYYLYYQYGKKNWVRTENDSLKYLKLSIVMTSKELFVIMH